MDAEFVLMLVSRWLHVLSAIVMAGGTIFMRFALIPALGASTPEMRQEVQTSVLNRWRLYVHATITVLIVTGFYNFYARMSQVKPMPYHALFGLKFLLAMVIFFIASVLVGRSKGLKPMRDNAKFWLNVNVVLAVIVVLIAGGMRYAPLKPTAQPSAVESAAE